MNLCAFSCKSNRAAGDFTHQNWDFFSRSMNVAIVTLVYTLSQSAQKQEKDSVSTSVFIYAFNIHPF